MGLLMDLTAAIRHRRWNWTERLAWMVLLSWAGLWILFSIGTGVVEFRELNVMASVAHLLLPVMIVLLMFLCWRWQVIGAASVVLISLILILWYGFDNWVIVAVLQLPPLVAGLMLAISWINHSTVLKLNT